MYLTENNECRVMNAGSIALLVLVCPSHCLSVADKPHDPMLLPQSREVDVIFTTDELLQKLTQLQLLLRREGQSAVAEEIR